jgi:hypothetical protein
MELSETEIYKKYLYNIELKKDSVIITEGFIGDNVSIEIIDHNLKKPKTKTLRGECLECDTEEKLDNFLYGLVHEYVLTKTKILAKDEVRQHVIEAWKNWKGGGKYGQR